MIEMILDFSDAPNEDSIPNIYIQVMNPKLKDEIQQKKKVFETMCSQNMHDKSTQTDNSNCLSPVKARNQNSFNSCYNNWAQKQVEKFLTTNDLENNGELTQKMNHPKMKKKYSNNFY